MVSNKFLGVAAAKFTAFAAATLVAVGITACGNFDAPVEVETDFKSEAKENPFNPFDVKFVTKSYIVVRATEDSVKLKKVSVNRGNCGTFEVDRELKFGQTYRKQISCSHTDVKEAEITTDKGTWTMQVWF